MTIYDDLQSVTSELLEEFQQGSISLIKLEPGTGPVDNPGPASETAYNLNATVSGVSFKHVANGFAVESDLMVTSAVRSDVTPSEKDFISIDGTLHKIVKDMSAPAAGTKVAWKFIIRKGG